MPKTENYFDPPHGGRPPSNQAVKEATDRYVEEGWRLGMTPSPEWQAAHPRKNRSRPALPGKSQR